MTSRRNLMVGAGAAALLTGSWWAARERPSTDPGNLALARLWTLSLATPSGATLPLQSLRGRPLVINFWATWCPPCVKEMPELDHFAQTHAAQGWQVLGIAVDQLEPVKAFLARTGVQFPVVLAGLDGLQLVRELGNPQGGLPFTVVVAAQGQILQRKLGATTAEELSSWAAGRG
jgi:thiol-disulfide isomerase/thioredoxin